MTQWQRRTILTIGGLVVAVVLLSLGVSSLIVERHEHKVMAQKMVRNPPWLMWGNSQTITIPAGLAAANPARQTQQMIKIAYARPTTWNFLLSAKILSIDQTAGLNEAVFVDWNLTTGLGRSQLSIATVDRLQAGVPGFARFVFVGAPINPSTNPQNCFIWTTSTRTPVLDQTATAPVQQNVNYIVGQDIQLNVSILYVAVNPHPPTPLDPLVIQLDAYFSPFEHIRPEWFKGNMGQSEDEGR